VSGNPVIPGALDKPAVILVTEGEFSSVFVYELNTVGDFVSTAWNCWFVFICKVTHMSTVYLTLCKLCMLHNEFYNLYSSPDIRRINAQKLKWLRYTAQLRNV